MDTKLVGRLSTTERQLVTLARSQPDLAERLVRALTPRGAVVATVETAAATLWLLLGVGK
jgi:hypothetical protein